MRIATRLTTAGFAIRTCSGCGFSIVLLHLLIILLVPSFSGD